MKLSTNCKTKENYREIVQYIKDFISNNEEVIIVNIGTDRCIGDAVAPIVGTMLKENNCKIPVYGTIAKPIHAKNLTKKIQDIRKKHPNAKIVGIDACIGVKEHIGEIQLRDKPICPGKGVGKTLPNIGDISIIGITNSDEGLLFSNDIRLDLVYKISSLITNIILESCDIINNNIKLYNKNTYTLNKDNENINKEIAIN